MAMTNNYLCVHGHFYQPPREDPFTGQVRREIEAAPFHDFNEKITAECYRPNAELGNFEQLSFDLGPTLAHWLARRAPRTLRSIQAAERANAQRLGVSNALALPYNHTILPLANSQEKRVQVAWGITDYRLRFGHRPEGMWLPETAVDLATLRVLADAGIRYTVLAPWQAAQPIDPSEPYLLDLEDGRALAVFFYQGPLSGAVSFNPDVTTDADRFAAVSLAGAASAEKLANGEPQLLLIATDGELYGHHLPWRDRFLERLLTTSAPASGWTVTSLGAYLQWRPPRSWTALQHRTSWSCGHGIRRWSEGCACTAGDSDWKRPLREALDQLAARLDDLYAQEAGRLLPDPWTALTGYLGVRLGQETFPAFLLRYGRPPESNAARTLRRWLELQYYRQLMMTSCGTFFEDLARVEPRNSIAYAARALSYLPVRWRRPLEEEFLAALRGARSWRSGQTGAEMYEELMRPAPRTVVGQDATRPALAAGG
jgi:alpha-amylase/alpha-mannosidase (GH57 family)